MHSITWKPMCLHIIQLCRFHADGTLWNRFQSLATFRPYWLVCHLLATDAALLLTPSFVAVFYTVATYRPPISWKRKTLSNADITETSLQQCLCQISAAHFLERTSRAELCATCLAAMCSWCCERGMCVRGTVWWLWWEWWVNVEYPLGAKIERKWLNMHDSGETKSICLYVL